MVSRQETQRALMTPGEVMQMSPADEVVMVSGTPPILAKKLRYFKDRNFTVRVMSPPTEMPVLTNGSSGWTDIIRAGTTATESESKTTSEGGREIVPVLDPPIMEPDIPVESDVSPEVDDEEVIGSQQTLETIRRAAALDLADDNTLPEF